MREYIITEEQVKSFEKLTHKKLPVLRERPYQSERDKVLDDVIHEISQAAPEMEGKKLFITVLALCRRIDKLRQVKE